MIGLARDGFILAVFFAAYVFVVDADDTCTWQVEWMADYCTRIGFGWE